MTTESPANPRIDFGLLCAFNKVNIYVLGTNNCGPPETVLAPARLHVAHTVQRTAQKPLINGLVVTYLSLLLDEPHKQRDLIPTR